MPGQSSGDAPGAPPHGPFAGLPHAPVVLQVLPALVTGGVERGTVEIAQAIAAAGGTALVASAGGPMAAEVERVGGEHIALPLATKNPLAIWRNAGRLTALIRARRVDIVHARSRAPAWSAEAAARRAGARFVTTFHGVYGGGFALKRAYNAVMTRGDRVIAITDFVAAHMRRVYGVEPERIRTIHRGVDLARFDRARIAPDRIRNLAADWGVAEGVPVVLLAGRLTRWKGQLLLLDAAARMARRDFVIVLAGSDQGRVRYRRLLERTARRLGLADRVRLVGDCRDMPAAYARADAVVSASDHREAFGRVMAEAMALGVPVVASDAGASREIVVPGETGWLFPPGDSGALAAALDAALSLAPDARAAMGARAVARVRACFPKERMAAATLALYAELLREPLPPA